MRAWTATALWLILTAAMPGVALTNVNLPKGLEGIIPIYPGSKILAAVDDDGTSRTTMETRDESRAVMIFYRKAMTYKGWEIVSGMILEGGSALTFSKGAQILQVTAKHSEADKTTIRVNIFR